MATKDATNVPQDNGSFRLVTWSALAAANDVGVPVPVGPYSDISVQLSGTLGTTPVVSIEGSNDGANWATLKNVHGTALSALAALTELHQVAEKPLFIRPKFISTAGGSPSINVVMVLRRPNQSRQ